MFTPKEKPKYQSMIEDELESVIRTLKSHVTGSDDYKQTLACVERLYEMRDKEKPPRISPETRVTVAANLIGILMILRHENLNPLNSKALNFVLRPR